MSSTRLDLPERLDLAATCTLAKDLIARRGGPLDLNAAAVARIGTPGLQVLLSAARTWRADGQILRLTDASPVLQEAVRTLGLDLAELCAEGNLN
ncbi:STAS domain-containing protein [Rubellimicrobium roseum]|uniref:STAS domain-containing protein n=1 Tax=Rubellimicrobium roseum TaxID=687525 RepID=A0A5C4NC67_9RHOB|nr:STAS domain-containing protein [Rubellimicrobium roseum]TNC72351.1 STAS domain-containing protein [Rubellimicrobium roseum]